MLLRIVGWVAFALIVGLAISLLAGMGSKPIPDQPGADAYHTGFLIGLFARRAITVLAIGLAVAAPIALIRYGIPAIWRQFR